MHRNVVSPLLRLKTSLAEGCDNTKEPGGLACAIDVIFPIRQDSSH